MIKAIKQTRDINKFIDVAIPSPRDLFRRYGQRESNGVYTDTVDERSGVRFCASQVPIAQLVSAERMINEDLSNKD